MIEVRSGAASDLETALDVWDEATTARRGGVRAPDDAREHVREVLSRSDTFLVLAVDPGLDAEASPDDGFESGVVGIAAGLQAKTDDGEGPDPIAGLCHLSLVYVRPRVWGQGIGHMLVRGALDTARERGFTAIQLWAQADNPRAQRLYEGQGFDRTGREKIGRMDELIWHYQRSL